MRIFISWSGEVSHQVAVELRDWLQQVINALDPFVSSKDIELGDRWETVIASELELCSEGIVIVTQENQHKPWLNFEAGALSKQQGSARVRTLVFDLGVADVTGPLSQFQGTSVRDRDDMLELIRQLAKKANLEAKLPFIERAFARDWPDLESRLAKVKVTPRSQPVRREKEIVSETLEVVRTLVRRTENLADRLASQEALLNQLLALSVATRSNEELLAASNLRAAYRHERDLNDEFRADSLLPIIAEVVDERVSSDSRPGKRITHPLYGDGIVQHFDPKRRTVVALFKGVDAPMTLSVDEFPLGRF